METMHTIDKRRRTSDGTAICQCCNGIIQLGASYVSETCYSGGVTVTTDTCMDCVTANKEWNRASWLLSAVLAIALFIICLILGSAGA